MQKRSLPMMPAIKPDKHEVLNNKGSALRKLGRYEDAITVYDAALDMKPDKHEALNSKSVSLLQLGRYEDAITLYEFLIKQTPKDVSPRYNRACGYATLQTTRQRAGELTTSYHFRRHQPIHRNGPNRL